MIFIESSQQKKKKKEFIAVHHITRIKKEDTKSVFNLNIWMNDSSESFSFSAEDERNRFFLGIEDLILSEQRGYFYWDSVEGFKRLTTNF